MKLADLDSKTLNSLLRDLQTTYDITELDEKYGIAIPQWLIIKYRCVACAKETRSRIQAISIRQAKREMICPFCRKTSRIFTIHTEKEAMSLNL